MHVINVGTYSKGYALVWLLAVTGGAASASSAAASAFSLRYLPEIHFFKYLSFMKTGAHRGTSI